MSKVLRKLFIHFDVYLMQDLLETLALCLCTTFYAVYTMYMVYFDSVLFSIPIEMLSSRNEKPAAFSIIVPYISIPAASFLLVLELCAFAINLLKEHTTPTTIVHDYLPHS